MDVKVIIKLLVSTFMQKLLCFWKGLISTLRAPSRPQYCSMQGGKEAVLLRSLLSLDADRYYVSKVRAVSGLGNIPLSSVDLELFDNLNRK